MKDSLSKINKVFENRIRLAIMSLLMVRDKMDFNEMKSTLDLTDGNLSSHASKLESAGYLQIEKRFVGKKPQTNYCATPKGKTAFRNHLDALEEILKGGKK
ncbi:MAG: transcriptional regulator [Bacteroidota bacterium]